MTDDRFNEMALAVQRMRDEIVAMQAAMQALRASLDLMRRQLQAKVNA